MADTIPVTPLSWHAARSMDPVERVDYYCVQQDDGCYVWTGATTKGYGIVQIGGHSYRVHQWVWENENGPLPVGHNLHHLCHNTRCREVSHLELLPAGEHNLLHGLRGAPALNATKMACVREHPFTPENTYIHNGKRKCRRCAADYQRERRARQKESI